MNSTGFRLILCEYVIFSKLLLGVNRLAAYNSIVRCQSPRHRCPESKGKKGHDIDDPVLV